jgi:hypothetical protein
MVYVSKIVGYLSTLNVAAQSKAGDLVVLVEVWVVADIPKLCPLVQWVSEEVLLLQLDPVGLVAVSEAALAEVRAAGALEGDSVVVIDLISEEEEEVLDIKVVVALVEEVGMVAAHQMASVMAQHHPLMHLLVPEEEEGSVVGTVALL